jgi:hypothetical protein
LRAKLVYLAREAGLSRKQQITAMRIGNVPKESFEAQVESDNPPSVTELARQRGRIRCKFISQ